MTVGKPVSMRGAEPGRITGRHVLVAFLAFFGIVIAVNGLMVFLALDSWTGLTDRASYRTGLSWNRTLEQDAAQKALGWSVTVDPAVRTGHDGQLLELSVTVRDRDGAPVPGLSFGGQARHPVVEALDRAVSFAEADTGRYVGVVELPPADWTLRLEAIRPDGSPYRIETRVEVR